MSKLLHLSPLTKWMVHIPALDTLRLNVFTWFSHHGTNWMDGSYKITHVVSPNARDYVSGEGIKKPAIFAVYHGRMVGLLGLHPRRKLTILISESRDGEIITRACQAIGFSIARGSIKRKAVQGAKALVDAARQGQSIAFMVDGPRGPRYEVKPGLIRLAELTKLPIIPFVCRSRSNWWFPSWDRFMGPLWGTPMLYLFGDPIHVPGGSSEAERQKLSADLEGQLGALREHAERFWS